MSASSSASASGIDLQASARQHLDDLVAFPTVTADPNVALIDHVEQVLRGIGAQVRRTTDASGDKANLFATIGPAVDGGVVLSGHTDVVPAGEPGWSSDPFVVVERDGRLYGRGTVDMKGFLACALAVAPGFAASELERPLHLAFTFDEEVGCLGAPLLIDDLVAHGPMPSAAIVGEPTSMGIVHAHKGCFEHTTTITGVAGHGSAPAAAVNAIDAGARYVTALSQLAGQLRADPPDDSPFDPPETTINVGVIDGGAARNVVADACRIEWDLRTVRPGEVDEVLAQVRAVEDELGADLAARDPAAGIVTTTIGAVDGLAPDADSVAVRLTRQLLDDPQAPLEVASFSTEAGLFQAAGVPAVVCGPGSIDVAHRPDEFIEVAQLEACLAMLERLRRELSAG